MALQGLSISGKDPYNIAQKGFTVDHSKVYGAPSPAGQVAAATITQPAQQTYAPTPASSGISQPATRARELTSSLMSCSAIHWSVGRSSKYACPAYPMETWASLAK
jgi:hypothetical protein